MDRSVAKSEFEAQVLLIFHTDYAGYSSAILTYCRTQRKIKRGLNVLKSKSLEFANTKTICDPVKNQFRYRNTCGIHVYRVQGTDKAFSRIHSLTFCTGKTQLHKHIKF